MEDNVIRVKDKGSRFVVLKTCDYVEKVEHQIIKVRLVDLMKILVLNLNKK